MSEADQSRDVRLYEYEKWAFVALAPSTTPGWRVGVLPSYRMISQPSSLTEQTHDESEEGRIPGAAWDTETGLKNHH